MYADTTSRAGVLEPEGIVEIKFRKAKVLQMMERLDTQYRDLKAATADSTLSADAATKAKTDLAAREKLLTPTYSQIALQFADLHDRANRMKAKGTIREALEWSSSRKYFYWRLRRRLAEETVLSALISADPSTTRKQAQVTLQGIIGSDDNDERSARNLEEQQAEAVRAAVAAARRTRVANEIAKLAVSDRAALLEGLQAAFGDSPELRNVGIRSIKEQS